MIKKFVHIENANPARTTRNSSVGHVFCPLRKFPRILHNVPDGKSCVGEESFVMVQRTQRRSWGKIRAHASKNTQYFQKSANDFLQRLREISTFAKGLGYMHKRV